MAWKHISDSLPAWLSAEIEEKAGAVKAPASGQVSYLPAYKGHTDRCMTTATPRARPRSAVVIHLVVDNSGRSPAGRSDEAPAFRRNSWRERARETGLRVVQECHPMQTYVLPRMPDVPVALRGLKSSQIAYATPSRLHFVPVEVSRFRVVPQRVAQLQMHIQIAEFAHQTNSPFST